MDIFRTTQISLSAILTAALLSSCGGSDANAPEAATGAPSVVTEDTGDTMGAETMLPNEPAQRPDWAALRELDRLTQQLEISLEDADEPSEVVWDQIGFLADACEEVADTDRDPSLESMENLGRTVELQTQIGAIGEILAQTNPREIGQECVDALNRLIPLVKDLVEVADLPETN